MRREDKLKKEKEIKESRLRWRLWLKIKKMSWDRQRAVDAQTFQATSEKEDLKAKSCLESINPPPPPPLQPGDLVQLQKVYIKPQQLKYGGPLAPWKWVMNRQLQSALIPPRCSVYQPLFPIKGLLSPGGHGGKMVSQTGGWMLRGFMGFWKTLWVGGNISLTGVFGSQQQEVSYVGSSRDSVKPSCYSGGRSLSLMAF